MSEKLGALIVDDESLAREDLRTILQEFNYVKIIAEADSIDMAVNEIKTHNPDLIFLDIKLPGESGFDLLNKIKIDAHIIFVTAYDEYAIRAFEVNAKDYLLKPVTKERMHQALENLSIDEKAKEKKLRNLEYDDRIFLLLDNSYTFLNIQSIIKIKAADDYTDLQLVNQSSGLALKSMQEWDNRLPEKHFVRIHRSTIININFIQKIEKWFNNSFKVYLKNIEEPVVISRRYATKIKDIYS